MARPLAMLAGAGAIALAAAGGHGASAEPSADAARTRSVTVSDDFFSRRSLRVSRRDVVRFVWRDADNPHNVTPTTDRGGRASRTTSRDGYVFRRRFSRTTRLVCTVHPDTMRITVRVRR